jgi:hypothetical protein
MEQKIKDCQSQQFDGEFQIPQQPKPQTTQVWQESMAQATPKVAA